jgi:hypothetical protein
MNTRELMERLGVSRQRALQLGWHLGTRLGTLTTSPIYYPRRAALAFVARHLASPRALTWRRFNQS